MSRELMEDSQGTGGKESDPGGRPFSPIPIPEFLT